MIYRTKKAYTVSIGDRYLGCFRLFVVSNIENIENIENIDSWKYFIYMSKALFLFACQTCNGVELQDHMADTSPTLPKCCLTALLSTTSTSVNTA